MLAAKGCHQRRAKLHLHLHLHLRVRGQGIKMEDATFQPVTVTGLSVFNASIGRTKSERKRIRSAVREFELTSMSTAGWAAAGPMYICVMGRVGRLLACGHPDGRALKARPNAIRRSYNIPLLEQSPSHHLNSVINR
jgi:hypothetical protein